MIKLNVIHSINLNKLPKGHGINRSELFCLMIHTDELELFDEIFFHLFEYSSMHRIEFSVLRKFVY